MKENEYSVEQVVEELLELGNMYWLNFPSNLMNFDEKRYQYIIGQIKYLCLNTKDGLKSNKYRKIIWPSLLGIPPIGDSLNSSISDKYDQWFELHPKDKYMEKIRNDTNENSESNQSKWFEKYNKIASESLLASIKDQINRDVCRSRCFFNSNSEFDYLAILENAMVIFFARHFESCRLQYIQGFHQAGSILLRVFYEPDKSCESSISDKIDQKLSINTSQKLIDFDSNFFKFFLCYERIGLFNLSEFLHSPLELSLINNIYIIGILVRQYNHSVFSLITFSSQIKSFYLGLCHNHLSVCQHNNIKSFNEPQECKYCLKDIPFDLLKYTGFEFNFCIPWLITLLSHHLNNSIEYSEDDLRFNICCRIWDAVLAGPPFFLIYLITSIIIHPDVVNDVFKIAKQYEIYKKDYKKHRFPSFIVKKLPNLPKNSDFLKDLSFNHSKKVSIDYESFEMEIISYFQNFFKKKNSKDIFKIIVESIFVAVQMHQRTIQCDKLHYHPERFKVSNDWYLQLHSPQTSIKSYVCSYCSLFNETTEKMLESSSFCLPDWKSGSDSVLPFLLNCSSMPSSSDFIRTPVIYTVSIENYDLWINEKNERERMFLKHEKNCCQPLNHSKNTKNHSLYNLILNQVTSLDYGVIFFFIFSFLILIFSIYPSFTTYKKKNYG